MDRGLLERYLEQGLSLERIGALEDRHPSTIGYWIKKHGLSANGNGRFAGRGGLTREDLATLVASGASLRSMAETLDRSAPTIRYWMKKYGLRTSRRHGRTEQSRAARAAGRTRFTSVCQRHGETEFLALPRGRSRCATCNSEAVARRRRKVKEILVADAGGSCGLCGFVGSPAAMEFHHLDPDEKSFALSAGGLTRSLERMRKEAAKCILLCAICHAEIEAGVRPLAVKLAAARGSPM